MADTITCCPFCSTSFRITEAQMQSAKGAVRCGSCLKVFRALDHLQPPKQTLSSAEENTPPTETDTFKPTTSPANTLEPKKVADSPLQRFDPERWSEAYDDNEYDSEDDLLEDDDVLISDDMGQADDGFGDISDDFLREGNQSSSLFERAPSLKNSELDTSDESWAEELLDEIESSPEDVSLTLSSSPHNDKTSLKSTPEQPETPAKSTQHAIQEPSLFDAELPVEQQVDDAQGYSDEDLDALLSENLGNENLDDDLDDPLDHEQSERQEPVFAPFGVKNQSETPVASPSKTKDVKHSKASLHEKESSEQDSFLNSIAQAPLEIDWQPEPSVWPRRLLWGTLSLLALLTLVGQYAWHNFSDLSRQQPWRSGFTILCPVMGCQLPSLNAPERIKAYNLVVRSHPKLKQVLIVDSILLNTASFEQEFPDFLLSFSALNGTPIAYRRFKPSEYLRGELAGASRMPTGQPIHISLEIIDPGPDAVNYIATIPTEKSVP